MAEQNKGLAGIFNDPNFITGISILAANSDPRRHWSEGYRDASERLSAMERSALNRAEMELRKQKFEQEQQQMEAQRAAQERMAALAAKGLPANEYLREALAIGASPQQISGIQTLAGLEAPKEADPSKVVRAERIQGPDGKFYEVQYNAAGDPINYSSLAGGVTVNTGGIKPPTGYMFRDEADPTQGVIPIPGGPAEKVSEGAAGRIAAINVALPGLAEANKLFMDEQGAIDRNALRTANLGTPGLMTPKGAKIRDAYERAIETVLRIQTGAAATQDEINRYMDSYLPKANDSKEVIETKMKALEGMLSSARELMGRGRGGKEPATIGAEVDNTLIEEADRIIGGGQ